MSLFVVVVVVVVVVVCESVALGRLVEAKRSRPADAGYVNNRKLGPSHAQQLPLSVARRRRRCRLRPRKR